MTAATNDLNSSHHCRQGNNNYYIKKLTTKSTSSEMAFGPYPFPVGLRVDCTTPRALLWVYLHKMEGPKQISRAASPWYNAQSRCSGGAPLVGACLERRAPRGGSCQPPRSFRGICRRTKPPLTQTRRDKTPSFGCPRCVPFEAYCTCRLY